MPQVKRIRHFVKSKDVLVRDQPDCFDSVQMLFYILFLLCVAEGRVLLELTHRCAGEGEKVSWVPTGITHTFKTVCRIRMHSTGGWIRIRLGV
jgi:hypothetical protein